MTTALEGGEGSASRPSRFYPGKYPVPIVQEAGWTQDRSGQVRKISLPPGFDPRTVQTVASLYTDYATRPTVHIVATYNYTVQASAFDILRSLLQLLCS